MTCDNSYAYLSAYQDDQLEVSDVLHIEQHLENCAACRQVHADFLRLSATLGEPGIYAHPSAEFTRRIQETVRLAAKEESRTERSRWFRSPQLLPAAGLLLAVVIVGSWLLIGKSHHEQLLAGAILTSHIRSLQAAHLVDVPSSDRHTVKPWFQGKLDFAPPVADLTDQGWSLAGGRLDYIEDRPVAALAYQRRLHTINVFLWPNSGAADDTIQQEASQGYQILHWKGAEMVYWVVSDLNKAELTEFAKALRGH